MNFWATWCAPCRREIPLLGRLQEQYGPEGFQVIGIAADYRDKVVAYAEDAKIGYPILIGEQEALDAAAAFGVSVVGFPFTVFSDSQGRIIVCHVGELTQPVAGVILGAVQQVNQGRTSPDRARSEIAAAIARLKEPAGRQGLIPAPRPPNPHAPKPPNRGGIAPIVRPLALNLLPSPGIRLSCHGTHPAAQRAEPEPAGSA